MTLDALGDDAVLAVEAVRTAVAFMQTVRRPGMSESAIKADASPATIADFAVQALLVARLRAFSDDPIAAEEDAATLRGDDRRDLRRHVAELVARQLPDASPAQVLAWIDEGHGTGGERFWVLVPIDGTAGLLRGGQYVIALALVSHGAVRVGAIGCPRLTANTGPRTTSRQAAAVSVVEDEGECGVAIAVRGRGAWWLPLRQTVLSPLAVSSESDIRHARLLHSHDPRHEDGVEFSAILNGLGTTAPPIAMDSQAKHVLIAAGAAELLLRVPPDPAYHDASWDHAAGALLVEEAGGRVTDLAGRPLDFTAGRRLLWNTGVIASNGRLHETVLDAIRHQRLHLRDRKAR
jgi:3'(2'), 5'-bisphosphate nucleotidase